jgi:hypothetical protein
MTDFQHFTDRVHQLMLAALARAEAAAAAEASANAPAPLRPAMADGPLTPRERDRLGPLPLKLLAALERTLTALHDDPAPISAAKAAPARRLAPPPRSKRPSRGFERF